MDATFYQIIFGELADLNCSLMDAFQDTFLENASLSLLTTDGFYCNATTDEIGTCWPRSSTGRIVERPCPEYINGVKYNTTITNHTLKHSYTHPALCSHLLLH
uniref:G-protein coupled receptors family 2 profile 1 domain-containing protein n=1 Tax=Labrus bergylta TaxID=56723 RepID=A0A3Q3MZ30_9LABR